jgi:heterodisulfide reductase subunit A
MIPIRNRQRSIEREHAPEREVAGEKPRIGVFVCNCGKNIGGYLDVEAVSRYASSLPNVVFAEQDLFACSEDTQKRMREAIQEHKLNRVVVAACSPITHGMLFQDTCEQAGLNKYLFEMANIRNQCSWVHSDNRERATEKAVQLVDMSVSKATHLRPLQRNKIAVTESCLIIGGGIAGIKAAINLSDMGIEVVLVEREAQLGGRLNTLHTLFPSDRSAEEIIKPLIYKLEHREHVTIFTNTEVEAIGGYVGNFNVDLTSTTNGTKRHVTIGTIIVATGFQEIDMTGRFGYG